MDRTVQTTINGQERLLNYSVEVMFDMTEKFGTIQKALEAMEKDDRSGFEVVRWFAFRMANDGELCRREKGEDRLPMLKEAEISLRMHPLEYARLKEDVTEAIINGYQRETADNEEDRDYELEELEAKKGAAGA